MFWNINEKSQWEGLAILMKYLLKMQNILWKSNEIAWNTNEKSQWEGLTILMKYLLKGQSISYERQNEITWYINEKFIESTLKQEWNS